MKSSTGKSPTILILRTGYLSATSNSKILGSIFALLYIGQSALTITLSTKSLVLCLASSVVISSSNSIFITEIPSLELDFISFKSLTPRNSSSRGSVISFSISSAVLPGNIVVTKILVELISGKSSLGIVLYAVIPDNKNNTIMT